MLELLSNISDYDREPATVLKYSDQEQYKHKRQQDGTLSISSAIHTQNLDIVCAPLPALDLMALASTHVKYDTRLLYSFGIPPEP